MNLPKRKQIYINNDLQFKYSLVLIVVVTVEVILFGGLINFVFNMISKSNISGNTFFVYRNWALLLIGFLSITVLNIFLGVFLSHKIAGPIYNFDKRLKELMLGDLNGLVELREGDELRDFEITLNEAIRALRNAVREDRGKVKLIEEKLKTVIKKIEDTKG